MTTYFVSNAGSNTAPYDTEAKAATTLGVIAALPWTAADTVKVSSTHTEAPGAALTYAFPTTPGLQVLSVLFNGAGNGALTVGASVAVGAASAAMTWNGGFVYSYGVTFASGTGNSTNSDFIITTNSQPSRFALESCTLSTPSTNVGANFQLGATAASNNDDCEIILINCTRSSANVTATSIGHGRIRIHNLALAGTAPTTVFGVLGGVVADVEVTASDLTGVAWTNLVDAAGNASGSVKFKQCKLVSGFAAVNGVFDGPGSYIVELIDSTSGDTHYTYQKHCWQGTVVVSNTVYADATDGTNSFSMLMTGNANTSFLRPLESPPIDTFNSVLSAITTTVEVVNDGTTFTDAQLWQETMAKVTSGFSLGTWNRADRAADVFAAGANQATSTKTWTGTGGFGAEVKQRLVSGSFTPAEVGVLRTVVKLGVNDNVYVSPKVAVG